VKMSHVFGKKRKEVPANEIGTFLKTHIFIRFIPREKEATLFALRRTNSVFQPAQIMGARSSLLYTSYITIPRNRGGKKGEKSFY